MRRDDHDLLIDARRRDAAIKVFKMAKGKTALVLVMIICSCGLIFSITDAYPTPEAADALQDDTKIGNNSRLVITHVVKTIEFEVGLVDDDGQVDENATDADVPQFYETNIQLLNVDLLREVVNQATGEENWEGKVESSSQQTMAEGDTEQVQNDAGLSQLNQTNS